MPAFARGLGAGADGHRVRRAALGRRRAGRDSRRHARSHHRSHRAGGAALRGRAGAASTPPAGSSRRRTCAGPTAARRNRPAGRGAARVSAGAVHRRGEGRQRRAGRGRRRRGAPGRRRRPGLRRLVPPAGRAGRAGLRARADDQRLASPRRGRCCCGRGCAGRASAAAPFAALQVPEAAGRLRVTSPALLAAGAPRGLRGPGVDRRSSRRRAAAVRLGRRRRRHRPARPGGAGARRLAARPIITGTSLARGWASSAL